MTEEGITVADPKCPSFKMTPIRREMEYLIGNIGAAPGSARVIIAIPTCMHVWLKLFRDETFVQRVWDRTIAEVDVKALDYALQTVSVYRGSPSGE